MFLFQLLFGYRVAGDGEPIQLVATNINNILCEYIIIFRAPDKAFFFQLKHMDIFFCHVCYIRIWFSVCSSFNLSTYSSTLMFKFISIATNKDLFSSEKC